MASFQKDDIWEEHPLMVPYRHDCVVYGNYDVNADYDGIDEIVKKNRVCSGKRHVYEPLNS